MDKKIYSVSEITQTIKMLLEQSLPTLWVEGEVSNFKEHYSGHLYFSLKDSDAQISAVMWKSRAQFSDFPLEDGLQIRALGNIRVYEKTGRYQIDIIQIQPAGTGKLQAEFEILKKKLYQEGLFAEENKKPPPLFPQSVAVITSPTGAAVQDILQVLKRRAPYLNIYIYPVKVQGIGAADEIANALKLANETPFIDVIIVGRGGGSLEDLWAFNEEIVARAIFMSQIPVVSAVGHEIDFTISDFVADLRAPTPSAAAEMIVPAIEDVANTFNSLNSRIIYALNSYLEYKKQRILSIKNSYGLRRSADIIRQNIQRVDDLAYRLSLTSEGLISKNKEKINQLKKQLNNLNPETILSRGYSITFKSNKIVYDASDLKKGDILETKVYTGKVKSIVD
ncbi:MAG: exodeoxyribonuclease VII large subunit [Calditrichae bacterium]|nr:exodeoxyribonuclease VII large subunit [Calditrichia bacterium]